MIQKIENNGRLKHEQVYDQLVEMLTTGKYQEGQRLPSERDFASQLDVNIATVRRAYQQLITGGIVEKRMGSGTYLKQPLHTDWSNRTINLIIESRYDHATSYELEQLAKHTAARHCRECRVIHADQNDLQRLLESCVTYQQPTIICAPGLSDLAVLHKAPELFVVISSMLHSHGIPTVRGDDNLGITLMVNHLQSNGHRRIALLRSGNTGVELEEYQTAIWQSLLGADYRPELKLTAGRDREADPMHNAYHCLLHNADCGGFTALIALNDSLMFGAAAALRELGKRIPGDVSILSIGNTPLCFYSAPPMSCIAPDLAGHLSQAFQMLEYNHHHPDRPELLRLVKPQLVLRKSTSNIL